MSRALLPYTTILEKTEGKFRPTSPHGKMVRLHAPPPPPRLKKIKDGKIARFGLRAAQSLISGVWEFAVPFFRPTES